MVFNLTELEKIMRAKLYMDKLAEGVDPISDSVLPEDTMLNNVRLSRCFYFVSDILRQVIENGGVFAQPAVQRDMYVSLLPFALPDELRNRIEISAAPAMITHFTRRINDLIDESSMQKLKATAFTTWLVNAGLLCEEVFNDKRRKKPTEAGQELGIFSEIRENQSGEYLAILYREPAQRYLVNNLDHVIAISNSSN